MSEEQPLDAETLAGELAEAGRLVEQFERFYRRVKPRATREGVREAGIVFFLTQAIRKNDRPGFKALAELSLKAEAERTQAQESSRRLALEQRKLKLLAQRQAQAEAVARSGLPAAERERRWREIFGLPAPEAGKKNQSERSDGSDESAGAATPGRS